jgi:lambda repressor-like predicted transcriptional regulator
MGAWSKLADQGERLHAVMEIVPSGVIQPAVRKPKQVQRRLRQSETAELVAGYQAGMTVRELAARHRISRQTVSAILERQGVPRRYRKLSDQQIQAAITAYQAGDSLATIATRCGVHANTIWNALRRVGVELRQRPGW